jgi:hypothetical protein
LNKMGNEGAKCKINKENLNEIILKQSYNS